MDDVIRVSFQLVIRDRKKEREQVMQAFVLSTHEVPQEDRCVGLNPVAFALALLPMRYN
jgi:hypothetical protein